LSEIISLAILLVFIFTALMGWFFDFLFQGIAPAIWFGVFVTFYYVVMI